MDGVIIDSNPVHKIALKEFCHKYGHDLTEQQLIEKIYGRTNRDWILNIFGNIPDEEINRLADEKEALFRKLYDNDIRLVDGLDTFLEKLDQYKIPRAIGTSAPRANVDFTFVKTHTERYFPVVLDSSFVTIGKPNPQIYLKCAAALNLPPAQCIVIEDSLAGVAAGKAAGCKVIGITTTHTPEELGDVDMVIDNFTGLDPRKVIEQLFN